MKKFKQFFTVVCAMLLSHALTVSGADLKTVCEPYLRFMDNQTAAVTFVVEGQAVADYYVEFAVPWRPTQQIKAQGVEAAPGKWVYNAEIKNLTPDLKCLYNIADAAGNRSKYYAFTVPSVSQREHTVFVTSDVHERAGMLVRMLESGRKADALLYVLLGDQVDRFEDNAYQTMMDGFLHKLAGALHGVRPVVVLRGNHDFYGKNYPIWHKFFPAEGDRTYYSLRIGEVFYLFLESGNAYQGALCRKIFAHQRKWLEQELQSEACRTAKFRVVMIHYPSHAIAESVAKITPLPLLGDLLMSTDPDKRIHLMLAGHRHRYIRTDAFSDKFKVNSSGFANVTAGLPGKPGKDHPYTLVIFDSFGHGGSADGNYILLKSSPERLLVQSLDEKNKKIDEFVITPDGKVTDLIPAKEFK